MNGYLTQITIDPVKAAHKDASVRLVMCNLKASGWPDSGDIGNKKFQNLR